MQRKACLFVLFMLASALLFAQAIGESKAASSAPVVGRVFYLSSPNSLTTAPPLSENPSFTNFTRKTVEFDLPPIVRPVALFGNLNFSLWVTSSIQTTFYLNASLSVKSLSGIWDNGTAPYVSPPRPVGPVPSEVVLVGNVGRSLILGDHVFAALRALPVQSANVTLLWGSASYSSFVSLPLSGYITLAGGQSVSTLDSSQNPTNDFDVNSSIPKIIFQASFFTALGRQDISRVNLTVVDSTLHSVRTATNLDMIQFPQTTDQPYVFTTTWLYPSNSTDGVYQVNIDVYDAQDSLAFIYRGPTTFRLSRTSPLARAALNLLPYVGISGVVIGGGAFYYRRRKAKSYFAPFDYFNTLTGGELNGGSAVTIEGNTGSGKTLLAEQLMFEDLKKGRPCVFLATGDFPSNVRSNMRAMGFDVTGYEQNGLLKFVDGYSSEAGQESREKISVPSLGDLTTLGMKISSSLPDESFKGGSLYFDSLTPLASKAKPENIVSFVQSVGARVKGLGGKAFFTLGPSVDPVVQRQLEEMADCVVQMEAFEEGGVRKSRLRISKLRARRHQQGWVIYTIEDGKGIIFYSKNPKQ